MDWIAVGRPSPGASSAAVLDIKRAFSEYKVSSSEKLTDLTSAIYGKDLTPLTASIREQLKALTTDSGSYATKLSVLDAWYKGEDASMAAITKQQYEALTSADSANARKVEELFAEMDFGYADRTKFANINRTMQRTFAMSIAVADWNQSQRIDTLQSEFKGNTAQIQNELLTLASKDLSITSEQTRLSAKVGENSAEILKLSLAVTDPEKGLSATVTQLQATAEAAQRLAGTKGEIIYSVAEPPAKDRLPQNLWFKKDGENTTPHVWDKDSGKWVALTDKAAAAAQAEAGAAKQAAGVAQGAAEAKGEVIFSSTAPEAKKQLKQNLWIDTANNANTPKRWDGSKWVEVTDKAAKDAAGAASTAQGAAKTAQDAADEADRKAREALGELDDISDDDKLTPSEKKQIRLIVDDIKQVDIDIRARAAKYGVPVTEYDAAFTALVTNYINDLLADYNTTSSIVRTEFNRKFNEFFAKRAQLDTSIAIEAKSVADKAQEAANNKGEVIYSSTAPAADKRKTQNLWVDTTGGKNVFKRWNGSAWVVATDQTAVDLAKNKGEVIYSATQPSVDKQLPQNIWYKQETVNGKAVVTPHVWANNRWTPLTDKGVVDAVDIANSKGEVITSDKIPDATKRLPQNLWIDTRNGKNTPRRWNGSAWEAVTDQAAIDAANDIKENLATYVEESGAFAGEFNAVSGKITTMQRTLNGQTDSIQVVASLGDAERLKYEIAKARLDKDAAVLTTKKSDLTSLIAEYEVKKQDLQAKANQAQAENNLALKQSYLDQIALLNSAITDASAQKDAINNQLNQLNQEKEELDSLKLTESKIKAQYFIKIDANGNSGGYGLLQDEDAKLDFGIISDRFWIASPDNKSKVRPLVYYPSSTTINGVTVPSGLYLDGNLLATGTITGDKIRANTEINAPVIKGGQININDKFTVDAQGNMRAIGGYFEGNIAANSVDVETLKRSAWTPGYKMFISSSIQTSTSPESFTDREFYATHVSYGSIVSPSMGYKLQAIGSLMFEISVNCVKPITVRQKLEHIDDSLNVYVNGAWVIRVWDNKIISFDLPAGVSKIQYIVINDKGSAIAMTLLGDFIDNVNVKFA